MASGVDLPPVAEPGDLRATIEERSPGAWHMVAETWRQRRLIPWFGARMVVKVYALTRLGRVWIVLRPLLTLFGGTLLFGAVLDTPSNGVPYLLFLVVGMGAWHSFDRTVFWATKSLDRYGRLWRNFYFPMLTVPIGAAGLAATEAAVYAVTGLITIAFYALFQDHLYLQLGPELLVGVAGLVLTYSFGLGLGLLLALLNMKGRDTVYTLRYVLQIWLYVTPVLYPVSALPPSLEFLATINPVAPMIELVQYGFIGAADIRPGAVAISCAATAVVLGAGLILFARRGHWVFRDILTYNVAHDERVET